MNKSFTKMFGGIALAVASIVALNACSGENGVDGKDGADGKDGVSATDTVYVVLKDTVFVKDTVILAGDTIVISKKDTVVVNNKDTVYIENGGSGSGNGGAGTGGNTSFGTLVDERDGQIYRTTKIGSQVWMAENLNVNVPGSMCYENKPENCEEYGRLYTWDVSMKACPSGWHLPSKEEFETLLENVGENSGDRDEKRLALTTDPYGFSALYAGYYLSDLKEFKYSGSNAVFWSSSQDYSNDAYRLIINFFRVEVGISDRNYGLSVRCLRDN